MKKKILVLTLVAALLIGLVSVISLTTLTASADPIEPSEYLEGSGTQSEPYQIGSVADWLYFANLVNGKGGANSGYFQLTADITFNEGDASTWGSSAPALNLADYGGVNYIVGYTCNVNPFVGVLDGNGHTISGVYINKTGGSCGLLGSTAAGQTATIKNLIITNSYYKSDSSGEAGALIGQLSGGTTYIQNVFVTDSVTIKSGGTSDGGLVGHCGANGYGDPTLYMDNCVNGATVDAGSNQYVGGLVGNGNGKQLYINNCLNYGTVKGGTNYLSGLVGRDDKAGSQFNYCVNIGTITPSSGTNYRQIVMSNSSSKKPILTNCLALTTSYGKNTTNNNCAQINKDGFLTKGFLATSQGQKLGDDWVELAYEGEIPGGTRTIKEICVPAALVDVFGSDAIRTNLYSCVDSFPAPQWILDAWNAGTVTITTTDEWKEFANFMNGDYSDKCTDNMKNKTVQLGADLDFEGEDITDYIVGKVAANSFKGTFDGQGHSISGVYMKKTAADDDTVGLFGFTNAGEYATFQNLIIKDSYFESEKGAVGALIAQTAGGSTTVSNVYVDADVEIVSGDSYAGGLVGHVGGNGYDFIDSTPGIIFDSCVNAATVTSTGSAVGGILGNGNGKSYTVSNCLNMGDITGSKSVGGIVGYGRGGAGIEINVEYCVNLGTITSASSTNAEKACAITSMGTTARDTLSSYACYYLIDTATYGVFEGSGESADGGATAVKISTLIGTTLLEGLEESGAWVARGDGDFCDVCIPSAVEPFAPAETKFHTPDTTPDWLKSYTDNDEFTIETVDQWKEFANFVNGAYTTSGDFEGKTVKLAADLDFENQDMTDYVIGVYNAPFVGTFDGQGHVISGFYVKKEGSDTAGIFGATAGGKVAVIKNFKVTASYFEAQGAVGAIVGQTSGGSTEIYNIYIDDDVVIISTGAYAGGLVGHVGQNGFDFIDGTPALIVDSCVNAASVTAEGKSAVGGILGNANNKNITVSNCLNMGNITGGSNVGGIIGNGTGGTATCEITVDGCVSIGKVVSSATASESAIANLSDKGTRTAINCYYLIGTANNGVVSGTDNSVEGALFRVLGNYKKLPENLDEEKWTARGDEITLDICIPTAVIDFAPETTSFSKTFDEATPDFLQNYEEDEEFLINSIDDWNDIATFLKGKYIEIGDFDGKTVKLNVDLDFRGTTPDAIGNSEYPFRGTFDGQGHTISGFNSEDAEYAGLFGVVGYGAKIKNFMLVKSKISGIKSNMGVIAEVFAASNKKVTIENIYVGTDVTFVSKLSSGWNNVGGILGTVFGSESSSFSVTISNCVFGGTIKASNGENTFGVGGIIGNGNGATLNIDNCLNFGYIRGESYTAGIVGINEGKTKLVKCVNARMPESEIWNKKTVELICSVSDVASVEFEDCFYIGIRKFYSEKSVNVDINAIKKTSIKSIFGTDAKVLSGWIARDEDVALPGGVFDFAQYEKSGLKVFKPSELETVPRDPEEQSKEWNGVVATSYAGGNGTESNPYKISNAGEWAYFATRINSVAETGMYYKLTADITFNVGDASKWGTNAPRFNLANYDDYNYIVGNVCNENPFVGTLDGDGHTISGVYINKAGGTVGLFGSTAAGQTAVIKNLVITNSYYEGDSSGEVGAIVGQTSGGETRIESVFVTDSVYIKSAGTSDGGFIGHCGANGYGDPTIYINNSVNGANIDAGSQQYVGGFIGNGNGKLIYINNCLNYGTVKGGNNYLAGFVGRDDKTGSEIKNSVNIGDVIASSGSNARQFVISNSSSKKPTITNCYALNTSYGKNTNNNDCSVITKDAFISAGFLGTVALENWIELASKIVDEDSETSVTEICVPSILKETLRSMPETALYSKTVRFNAPVWLIEAYENGEIEIGSVEEYKAFVDFFNGKYIEQCENGADGITVKLTSNLLFNTGDASTWGDEAPENDMTPYILGSWENPFRGIFDGQKHIISGFYAKKTGSEDTVGIIGCTAYGEEATVQDLVITNSYFESEAGTVAACVAQTEGGVTTIKNIYVTDSVYVVSGSHYAGGIIAHVGQGSFSTPELIVDSCVSAATVSAIDATNKNCTAFGGIVGNGNQKNITITNCLNMGNISGYRYVGGIMGFGKGGTSVEIFVGYCINTGIITTEYETDENGKACAIVCLGETERDNLTAEFCYYIEGSAEYGVYEGDGEGDGSIVIYDIEEIIGEYVEENIVDNLTEWILREDLIMIPEALVDFELTPVVEAIPTIEAENDADEDSKED